MLEKLFRNIEYIFLRKHFSRDIKLNITSLFYLKKKYSIFLMINNNIIAYFFINK